jgi:hypothetical protein
VLICPSDKLNVFKNKITEQITKFRLEIKESKTSIVNFNTAKINQPYLSYLGLDYNGKKIIIRQNTISRFYSKLLSYKNFKNKYSINKKVSKKHLLKKFNKSKTNLTFRSYVDQVCKKTGYNFALQQIKNLNNIVKG